MQLPCPFCGPRDEAEFRYGGEADVHRPGPPESVTDTAWEQYLFHHAQVRGWQAERWHHRDGCRVWFNLWRHTVTHAVGASAPVGAPVGAPVEAPLPGRPGA